MKTKVTRVTPLSVTREYYHKKYFRRFAPDNFRQEMRDHITGGPAHFADWQFKRMAQLKADCYADGLGELNKAKAIIDKLAATLPADQAAKLKHATEQLESAALLFTDAALGQQNK